MVFARIRSICVWRGIRFFNVGRLCFVPQTTTPCLSCPTHHVLHSQEHPPETWFQEAGFRNSVGSTNSVGTANRQVLVQELFSFLLLDQEVLVEESWTKSLGPRPVAEYVFRNGIQEQVPPVYHGIRYTLEPRPVSVAVAEERCGRALKSGTPARCLLPGGSVAAMLFTERSHCSIWAWYRCHGAG